MPDLFAIECSMESSRVISLTRWADRVARSETVAESLVFERQAGGVPRASAMDGGRFCLGFYPASICVAQWGQPLCSRNSRRKHQEKIPIILFGWTLQRMRGS